MPKTKTCHMFAVSIRKHEDFNHLLLQPSIFLHRPTGFTIWMQAITLFIKYLTNHNNSL